jgi:hypothetical protein
MVFLTDKKNSEKKLQHIHKIPKAATRRITVQTGDVNSEAKRLKTDRN